MFSPTARGRHTDNILGLSVGMHLLLERIELVVVRSIRFPRPSLSGIDPSNYGLVQVVAMTTTVITTTFPDYALGLKYSSVNYASCESCKSPSRQSPHSLHELLVPNLPPKVTSCAVYKQPRQSAGVIFRKVYPREPLM